MARKLYVVGENSSGQAGTGTLSDVTSVTQIGSDTDWVSAIAGNSCGFAIKNGGELWVTGSNSFGELGLGHTNVVDTWTQVGSDTDWEMVASAYHSVAIKGGKLYVTGEGSYYRLGTGSTADITTWTQIGSATNWVHCGVTNLGSFAVNSDGELWYCGTNSDGQLGAATSTTWTQYGSDTDWVKVVGYKTDSAALKTDGTLWTTGENAYGACGQGSTDTIMYWTQVGTDTDWQDVSCGEDYIIAIKDGNHLYGSGLCGTYDNMGSYVTASYWTSFQLIHASTDWSSPAAGTNHSAGILNGNPYGVGLSSGYVFGSTTSYHDYYQFASGDEWVSVSTKGGTTYLIEASTETATLDMSGEFAVYYQSLGLSGELSSEFDLWATGYTDINFSAEAAGWYVGPYFSGEYEVRYQDLDDVALDLNIRAWGMNNLPTNFSAAGWFVGHDMPAGLGAYYQSMENALTYMSLRATSYTDLIQDLVASAKVMTDVEFNAQAVATGRDDLYSPLYAYKHFLGNDKSLDLNISHGTKDDASMVLEITDSNIRIDTRCDFSAVRKPPQFKSTYFQNTTSAISIVSGEV